MKRYKDFVNECQKDVKEIFPWDLRDLLDSGENVMLLDIREPYEYNEMRIEGSINVPRGVLECASDWGYEETVPDLALARDKKIIVICRSGLRSILACWVMQLMGYEDVTSLKTGIRGWNDSEEPLIDEKGNVIPMEQTDEILNTPPRPEQLAPSAN
ncbi:MAG: rhodanese-like domain-containing protein [Spirochaetia bacterium]|nr:rhodanese-like domain-containing protein [Spirochaetia bacterium]